MTVNPLTQLLPATVGLAAAALYLAAAASLAGSRVPWPRPRTASFLAGVAMVVAGFAVPGAVGQAGHDPRLHMGLHLALGMLAPLLLALSAPVTLAVRTVRAPARRRLVAWVASSPIRAISHPFTALVLSYGGLYVLYLTPLHAEALHDPALGLLIQAHVVLSGTLFAWAIVGVDHVPRRPSWRVRGAALLVGIALHTALSRLLFADADRLAAQTGGTADDWTTAAEIMWFEGDLIELAIVAVFAHQAMSARRRAATRAAGGRRPRRAVPDPL
jgi:putative membrane protein